MEYSKSRELYERACRTAPGGIHSNVRANWRPVPVFYERGEGSRVWDADGNEYIDYVLARGPLLLGHSPGPVIEAVKRALDRGLMYAGQHELEIEAAETFCSLVPCADMVRFDTTGSQAVHGVIRLARAVTGRTKIIRFEGHYHGWFDSVFWSFAPSEAKAGSRASPRAVPMSRGQVASDAEHLILRPWNDLELVEQAFAEHSGEIAAVLCEPIMCNSGAILPREGFLEGLRELCTKHGALLIFDEVITGFRVSLGGAQKYFDVTPDLATFAKGMAAGFPVSAIAGKRKYMQAFAPGGPESVTHAGTYNTSVPCMAATLAAMRMLSADDGAALKQAWAMGERLIAGIRDAAAAKGRDVHVRGVPTAFHVTFNDPVEFVDYRTFARRDVEASQRFWSALQERGVRTVPEGLWFVSTAHSEADVERTLSAVAEAMEAV
ncbi:MAG: aspartate aminotransferase family protein [Gemmatimonadetes bacterium]|nr:aspartate aminotransferase family protein [Gemmatimonadota bacterium]